MQPDLSVYDKIIVAFSGGKDSTACFLHLLDIGVPNEKIELWHHLIDGREGSTLMDWPVTEDYCRKFAAAFDVPIYYSWKVGGFEREMLRDGTPTAPICFETTGGKVMTVGGESHKVGTRLKFPQVSANLSVRWCSSYLKIDVCSAALRHDPRLTGLKILMVTGERAQESGARANYETFEPHRADLRHSKTKPRHIDHWRPVHAWDEVAVWEIFERYGVVAHPAYYLGWGRLSCMKCIFGSPNQWASSAYIDPRGTAEIGKYEADFGVTIHRTDSVGSRIAGGRVYRGAIVNGQLRAMALSKIYTGEIITKNFILPHGAYGEGCGPT